MLVGCLPGPKEPSTSDMNHYLRPLVDDLLEWYGGQIVRTAEEPNGTRVRLALLNNACDIPAARKTSGFLAHSSRHACHKCARIFETTNHRIDYSGFELDSWVDRDTATYRQHAQQWLAADTMAERVRVENDHGARWSELHRLEYFDPVRCTIVDPMHNLFLGTAKRMTKIWLEDGDIRRSELKQMQRVADTIVPPPDYVSLKRKIESGFSFMTADDWKSWVLVYSPIVLQGVIGVELLAHWLCFVDACRLLVRPSITNDDLDEAHTLLQNFCIGVEEEYGQSEITPNMHLHMHLFETVENFGPLYGYWLFSFERYNGYLKDIDTNQKDSFETTFMRKFQEKTGARDFVRSHEPHLRATPGHLAFLYRFVDCVQPI